MIAIIDYGAGNLSSVQKALNFLGADNRITADPAEILAADRVILPGVGAFGDAMAAMRSRGLVDTVREAADGSRPFLGICLGLQLLFAESEESPGVAGLGIFDGGIRRIPGGPGLKVPHIGWNDVQLTQTNGIFRGVAQNSYFYFVHSFYLDGAKPEEVAGVTRYGVPIQCAVQRGKVAATQFHPEKSGAEGLQLLKNFISGEEK